MTKKRIFLIGAVLLAVGLAFVGYSLFAHTATDYLTVSQLKAKGDSLQGQQVKVKGRLDPVSINWDAKSQVMRFVLSDNSNRLNVVYQGVVPDSFKPGAELLVEGRYSSDSQFQALSFPPDRSVCKLCHS